MLFSIERKINHRILKPLKHKWRTLKAHVTFHKTQPLLLINKESPQFIITLTSYGTRIHETAPFAIATLMNQCVKPDRIILWLAHGSSVSPLLRELEKKGLEIYFCEDLKSYKKIIPALKKFPNDILVTADDDLFYPVDWFKKLKESYFLDPKKIHVHRASKIICEDNLIRPYLEWPTYSKTEVNQNLMFPTSGGGILYPPHTLSEITTQESLFMSIAPHADDIWLWAMARLQKSKFCLVKNGYHELMPIILNNPNSLFENYNKQGGNDIQFEAALSSFPELKSTLY